MSNRRQFLQRLGIGAIVAPIGVSGLLEPTVRILKPAAVESVPQMPSLNHLEVLSNLHSHRQTLQVLIKSPTGDVFSFEAEGFVVEAHFDWPSPDAALDPRLPVGTGVHWEMNGYLTNRWKVLPALT